MTKGEYRVGISFNPSGDDMVGQIKRAAANLIDLVESIEIPVHHSDDDEAATAEFHQASQASEIRRLKALAQTDIETAAMHAVKAATKRAPE